MTQSNPRDIIYTPADVATIGRLHLEKRRADAEAGKLGIPIGVPSLDKELLPALGGELITILGRPGHGKTALMMAWARNAAYQLVAQGEDSKQCVVYITNEQSVEELFAFNAAAEAAISITELARGRITAEQWEAISRVAVQRTMLPLYIIGHSQERRRKRPYLTADFVCQAIYALEEELKIKPAIIFADYLQRFKMSPRTESRVVGMTDSVDRFKDLALEADAPVVLGVQARREVDDSKSKIPEMDDGQWSSNIEQSSDKSMSVVRAIRYVEEGAMFSKMIVKGHNQCLISVLKQKMGPAPLQKWVFLAPEFNKLADLELVHYDFGNDPYGTGVK